MWQSVRVRRVIPAVTMLAGTFATADAPQPGPQPGMLNSLTGQVWMNGVAVGPVSAGRVTLEPGRPIKTGEGMAELLLMPGSVLRLGTRSDLTMVTTPTSEIRVRLRNGEALLEVLDSQTPIVLEQNGFTAVVREPGLYDFDEKRAVALVYAGEARVSRIGKQTILRKGLGVSTRSLREFQTGPDPGSTLLSWSRSRSERLSSESAESARAYPGGADTWHGPAWYWDPWSASYTFLSASGFVTGPFGWPYYSPGYAPNYIPVHPGGDSWLFGPPVLARPGPTPTSESGNGTLGNVTPTVPLTAPGVPQFPNNRF